MLCSPETAFKHTGYLIGGTLPFDIRTVMPIHMVETIINLPRIYINDGKSGYLVGIDPNDALRVLKPALANVRIEKIIFTNCLRTH